MVAVYHMLKAAVVSLALVICQGFSVLNINKSVIALEAVLSLLFEAVRSCCSKW